MISSLHVPALGSLAAACLQVIRTYHRAPSVRMREVLGWRRVAEGRRSELTRLRGSWAGESVVCVGNGPSLAKTDLTLLNERKVIGTNRAYKILDRIKPAEFMLVIQDDIRLQEMIADATSWSFPVLIGKSYYSEAFPVPDLPPALDVYPYMPVLRWHSDRKNVYARPDDADCFSDDPHRGLYYGYSVIFSAIQFAAYFGAKRIICIGIDMDYSGAVSFIPGVSHLWPEFSYEEHCKGMFEVCRRHLEERGIELINSTPGGKVDVLRRLPLSEALQSQEPNDACQPDTSSGAKAAV